MRRFLFTAAASIALLPSIAAADTIEFEADDGVRFVRCVDMFGSANCDLISETDETFSCVAINADGTPLATATFSPDMTTSVLFPDLDYELVANVVCRAR